MKAFASDFDGTLFFGNETKHFKDRDIKAIRDWQEQGNLFGLCTGRTLGCVVDDLEGIINVDFYILSTGSKILNKNQNIIFDKPMKETVAQNLYDYFDDLKPSMQVENYLYSFKEKNPFPVEQIILNNFDDLPQGNIYQLTYFTPSVDRASRICFDISQKFGNEVDCFQNTTCVDITHKGCSKGSGLKIFKDEMKIDLMCCMGDSYNDISMLVNADLAFTFSHSPAIVQQNADYTVGSIAEAMRILSAM